MSKEKGSNWVCNPRLATSLGLAILAFSACSVQAQVITENLTGDLGGFIDVAGNTPAPISSVDASFTVTFNYSSFIAPTTSGLTVNSYSGPSLASLASPIEYDWDPSAGIMSIGATANPSTNLGLIFPGSQDLVFQFNLSNPSDPKLSVCSDPGFSCGTAQGNALFYASGYTLASSPNDGWLATVANGVSVNSAPEIDPASTAAGLSLLLGGLLVSTGARSAQRKALA
jgi:hypothetical protein